MSSTAMPLWGSGSGSGSSGIPWGSNQFMSYPNMNPFQTGNAGIVPSQSNFTPQTFNATDPWGYGTGGANALAGGEETTPTMSPQFTQQWYNYLTSQLGQGVQPFNLSSILPSTGQTTAPGQLTAPLTPTMQQLQSFLMGQGTSTPGLTNLGNIASGNMSSLPEWNAMVAAQQQNIQENEANLKEQFGFAGDLSSSPFGTAMSDYSSQTALGQNALLGQLTLNDIQNQVAAGSDIANMGQQTGSYLQGLDQNAITALYNEFIRTQPQNNPLLSFMGSGAMATPSTYEPAQSSIFGDLGSILGGAGSLALGMGGIGGLGSLLGFGGGGGGTLGATIPGGSPSIASILAMYGAN